MTLALQIRDVRARLGDLEILRGVDLDVPFGEIHALMGPNGSGKSTLCHVLMGKAEYEATGSAVVANLALAKVFASHTTECTVRFAFFVNEEFPYYMTPAMGSLRDLPRDG